MTAVLANVAGVGDLNDSGTRPRLIESRRPTSDSGVGADRSIEPHADR
jgi:hypothetical protein